MLPKGGERRPADGPGSVAAVSLEDIEDGIDGLKGGERETVVKARINQSRYRDILLSRYGRCVLCGMDDRNLLVASHIKPWKDSTDEEKTDGDNGLLLCPAHDSLFDKGFISFDDNGRIRISDRLSEKNRELMNIRPGQKIPVSGRMKGYLKYHREHVYSEK